LCRRRCETLCRVSLNLSKLLSDCLLCGPFFGVNLCLWSDRCYQIMTFLGQENNIRVILPAGFPVCQSSQQQRCQLQCCNYCHITSGWPSTIVLSMSVCWTVHLSPVPNAPMLISKKRHLTLWNKCKLKAGSKDQRHRSLVSSSSLLGVLNLLE